MLGNSWMTTADMRESHGLGLTRVNQKPIANGVESREEEAYYADQRCAEQPGQALTYRRKTKAKAPTCPTRLTDKD